MLVAVTSPVLPGRMAIVGPFRPEAEKKARRQPPLSESPRPTFRRPASVRCRFRIVGDQVVGAVVDQVVAIADAEHAGVDQHMALGRSCCQSFLPVRLSNAANRVLPLLWY